MLGRWVKRSVEEFRSWRMGPLPVIPETAHRRRPGQERSGAGGCAATDAGPGITTRPVADPR
jgi:hypothetical protein